MGEVNVGLEQRVNQLEIDYGEALRGARNNDRFLAKQHNKLLKALRLQGIDLSLSPIVELDQRLEQGVPVMQLGNASGLLYDGVRRTAAINLAKNDW